MAAWVVVDSGILIASVLKEPYTAQAKALLGQWKQRRIQLAAPTLFIYEVVAAMRKFVVQGRVTPAEAVTGRDYLLRYPVQFHIDDQLLRRGYELATQLNRPTAYDSQYLAVAERLTCEFWTADEKLFNAVSSQLSWVRWIGLFKPQSTP